MQVRCPFAAFRAVGHAPPSLVSRCKVPAARCSAAGSLGTGRVQGLWVRLRAPLTVAEWGAVCAFGKDHVARAGNFDTGERDAAEVVHQLGAVGSVYYTH